MYKGSAPPGFYYNRELIVLPRPVKEKEDDFERLTKEYENVFGELIPGKAKWRYKNEYTFSRIGQDLADLLIEAENRGKPVMWLPHTDLPILKYPALISVTLKGAHGLPYLDTAVIRVTGTKILYKKPSIDNLVTGLKPTLIAIIEGE